MHITGMKITGIPPFTKSAEFDFDERVNIFIGPNGTGKSTVLRQLFSKVEVAGHVEFYLSDDWAAYRNMPYFDRQPQVTLGTTVPPKPGVGLLPWVYFPPTRHTLPLSYDSDAMERLQQQFAPVLMVFDGEEETPNPLSLMRRSLSRYSFSGDGIAKYCKAVTDLFRAGRTNARTVTLSQDAKESAYDCVQRICTEILPDGNEPEDYIYEQPVGSNELTVTNIHDDMGIRTNDIGTENLFMGDLSSGTQTTLQWIWYLAIELAHFHSHIYRSQYWRKQPAILLIDEIENHLHPTWQRRVIPALLEHFPGLQIFATTHSPFVVAGLKAGQVHLLNRDENGVVTATTNTEDVVGWTADEILRVFMGVDDPTDKDTAEAAAALRKLRDEGPRVDEREEERRQSEIARLRQIVDRAELSGPRVAEDARFLADLESILERHRESQELNQENG